MARGKGSGMLSQRYDKEWGSPRYHFGSAEERRARTHNNQRQDPPTHFVQIGPGDGGGSLNEMTRPPNKSGHFKNTPGI